MSLVIKIRLNDILLIYWLYSVIWLESLIVDSIWVLLYFILCKYYIILEYCKKKNIWVCKIFYEKYKRIEYMKIK